MTSRLILLKLLAYVKPYQGRLILLVILSLMGVIFAVAKPLPVKFIIDNVILKKNLPEFIQNFLPSLSADPSSNNLLMFCLVMMAIILVGGVIINYLTFLMTHRLGLLLVYDLSLDLYKKFQSLSVSFYSRNKVGDLLQRFNGDIFVVYLLVAQIILPIILSLLSLAGMMYIMFLIDPMLALIALSIVPILLLLLLAVSRPMNTSTMEQYSKQGELSAFVHQSLVSMRVIQAFVRENYMLDKLIARAMGFKKAYYRSIMISEGYNQSTNLVTGIASVILIGMGAAKGITGEISPGDLFVFLGYIAALYGPVNSLAIAAGTIIAFGARGKRVIEILDSEEEIRETPHATELKNVQGAVEFRNVVFGYNRYNPGETCVLKDIQLKVPAGTVIAIVGPTGAGKTSLISLLGRFHEPWSGSIMIDGKNIADLKVKSLRRNISMVLQEPILFPVSIAENIAFGNPEASMDLIMEAARLSEAHDFIKNLPQGYDTIVSESGLSLSGGEKQRLSLARAFLMNTPVIILDEPTSAVDALTEARIFERLRDHYRNRTVLVISHRLSTIKNADQIVVLENGTITEMGTHAELINNKKLYFDMYSQQTIG